jgi:phosphatidylglycerophosphate synthase
MKSIQAQIPNALSVGRLVVTVVICILVAVPASVSLLPVQILAAVGVISDKLDGTLARYWGVESDLGKRLESFADPLFSLAVFLYVAVHIGFPQIFMMMCAVYFVIGTLGRVLASMLAGELFYEKSQITRYGVGMLFVLLLMYLYGIPYREWLTSFMMGYGTIMFLNYLRLQVRFVLKHRT